MFKFFQTFLKGFPSSPSADIVRGKQSSGGLIGESRYYSTIQKSGVVQGRVSGDCLIGGAIGYTDVWSPNVMDYSELYVKETVRVSCSGPYCGGLFGGNSIYGGATLIVSNSFSRAQVDSTSASNTTGGFVGYLNFLSTNSVFNVSHSYSSSVVGATFPGSSIGSIAGNGIFYSKDFLYNNQSNVPPIPAFSQGNSSYSTNIDGLSCVNLALSVLNFNQSIWTGDSLISSYNSSSLVTLCQNFTIPPSTTPPSTNPPSTTPPSTTPPSTTPPTTTPPSTTPPSTTPPSTTPPSTTPPSTTPPSTNPPSTTAPSTKAPSTLIPSTTTPSTTTPSTTEPSTNIPSTLIPTQSSCLYNVLNCQNCGLDGIQVDQSLFNISCVLVQGKWVYSFKNKTSDTFQVTQNLSLNNKTVVFIEGDFNQSSSSVISFNLSLPSANVNARSTPFVVVSDCIDLNGEIELNIDERASNNQNFSFTLFSYNCSSTPKFSDSQIVLNTNYKGNNCDQYNKFSSVNQNTLSVSISSTLNKNCKGISRGAIAGILIGAVVGSLLIILLIIFLLKRRKRLFEDRIQKVHNEMENVDN